MGYEEDIYKRAGFTLDTDRDEMEAFITQQYQSVLTSGKSRVVDTWFEPNEIKEDIESARTISNLPRVDNITSLEIDQYESFLKELRISKLFDIIDEAEVPADLPIPTDETRRIIETKQREIADDFERELISRGILSGSTLERELDSLRTTSKGRQLAGGIKGRLRKIEKIREEELEK